MRNVKLLFLLLLVHNIFINNVSSQELKSIPNNYFIVVGDKVNVREKPDKNSKILEELNIGEEIRILKKSGKKEKIGAIEGEWVFVDTKYFKDDTHKETLKAWVFDYYLADLKNFKKVNSFIDCTIEGFVGDLEFYYIFNSNGTYKKKDYINSDGEKFVHGRVYQYNKVVVAIDEIGRGVFYFNEEGILCDVLKDEYGNPFCCIKMKK